MLPDLGGYRIPFLLPLLLLGGAAAWAAFGRRRAGAPATVLICVACERSVPAAGCPTACPGCGGALEDLRGFYERHPERRA